MYIEVAGNPRQARRVARQVKEFDRVSIAFRQADMRRQILADRIIERDFAALSHIGEQKDGEQLGHRPDLEKRVGTDGLSPDPVAMTMGYQPALAPIRDADRYSDAQPTRINALCKQISDFVVGRKRRYRLLCHVSLGQLNRFLPNRMQS